MYTSWSIKGIIFFSITPMRAVIKAGRGRFETIYISFLPYVPHQLYCIHLKLFIPLSQSVKKMAPKPSILAILTTFAHFCCIFRKFILIGPDRCPKKIMRLSTSLTQLPSVNRNLNPARTKPIRIAAHLNE